MPGERSPKDTFITVYGRKHYVANRATYISRNNRRSRAHTRALKQKVWAYRQIYARKIKVVRHLGDMLIP